MTNLNLGAFNKLGCGMYVICSRKDGKFGGQIANTVFQVASQPPTIAVSINKQNLTHEYMHASKVFTVSVLSRDTPLTFIGRFGFKSGRETDKFQGINYKMGVTQAPIVLDHSIAYLEAKVVQEVDVGTHTVFIGEVVACDVIKESQPMSYDYYHEVKRGATPKAAPSYIEPAKTSDVEPKEGGVPAAMTEYQCTICGYVYDPAQGDPDSGVKPGTPFESLPDGWVCPVCGASKDKFEKLSG